MSASVGFGLSLSSAATLLTGSPEASAEASAKLEPPKEVKHSPRISSIFKADTVTPHVSREKDKENALGRCRDGTIQR
jgi:hypothetical protein